MHHKRRTNTPIEPLESRIAPAFAATIYLGLLSGADGFAVDTSPDANGLSASISGAGDVNGDGFDDILIGVYGQNSRTGAAYVVFGKMSGFSASANLATLNGTNGFKLTGTAAGDRAGVSVGMAGDVNADGFGDIIIGANGTNSSKGAAYVVLGRSGTPAATLALSSALVPAPPASSCSRTFPQTASASTTH